MSTHHEKSLDRNSIQVKGYDNVEGMMNTPSSLHSGIQNSVHSYSKYSSLGGTHSIDNKRRKLKNTGSLKKNYRSANLTGNPAKMAKAQQMDHSKKRYQYHKRIRSDTGHTILNPLDHIYDKAHILNGGITDHPSFRKPKTDMSTPVGKKNEHRSSVMEKKMPENMINCSNTIQVNKYDFIPSFKHHKNISMDSNVQYRKFKTNKNPTNMHQAEVGKVKKPFQHKVPKKTIASEGDSMTNMKYNRPYESAFQYSPKKPDDYIENHKCGKN
jgi:hypothetical protein